MEATATFRKVGDREWESHDWRWRIVENLPERGTYSVRDYAIEEWVYEAATFEAAVAFCERRNREDYGL